MTGSHEPAGSSRDAPACQVAPFRPRMPPSLKPLLAAWAIQAVSIPAALVISHYQTCLLCHRTSDILPAGTDAVVYYVLGALSIALLPWHLFLIRTIRYRIVSLLVNGVLGFGSFVGFVLLYLEFGHWHC